MPTEQSKPRRPIPTSTRLKVFKRDSFTCQYCRKSGVELCIDHKNPVANGGTNDELNLVTSCVVCNSRKGSLVTDGAGTIRRALNISVLMSADDGHSSGESALYNALWRAAQEVNSEARMITLGYRQMSSLTSMTANNCKANIRSLEAKLAVKPISPFSYTRGRSYMVFSPACVEQRRRDAGVTHYSKTRGVILLNPTSQVEITRPRK